MNQLFEGMPGLYQAFWWVAIIASIIFVIQTILTFAGADHNADGINADFSGNLDSVDAPFQMFTLRNLINFLLGFGWSGVAFYRSIPNNFFLILVATCIGIVFILAFFFIIRQILRLSEDNTFDINKLIGLHGDVYLFIPENMTGKGKVQISVKGATHELPAMTQGEAIPTGVSVKVVRIDNNILIVKQITE